MVNKFDVIVSGAGPSGCKCAEIVAKAGYNVALIERDSNWRKPCGGAVNSRIFKYYPQLRKINFIPISGITLYSADYHELIYSWKGIKDSSINVDRLHFDNIIREIAMDSGAKLFDNTFSHDFIIKKGRRIGIKTKLSSKSSEFFAKIIIVADGMSSKLAIKSGLRKKWKINEIGIVKCAILEGENNLNKESISLFFKPFKGYSWIFPLNNNRFNIGCGTWQEENLNFDINQLYIKFLKDSNLNKILPHKRYKKIWEASYPIPAIGVKEKCLYNDNLMIIGDAAGFVSPISGEGIYHSIVSGNVAGETAIKALEEGEILKESLKPYKNNRNIKKIIRNFKMKLSLVDFFFENKGENFTKMLSLAQKDEDFKEQVVNMFLFNQIPSKDFILRLNNYIL